MVLEHVIDKSAAEDHFVQCLLQLLFHKVFLWQVWSDSVYKYTAKYLL